MTQEIPIDAIVVNGRRETTPARVASLAKSIEELGLMHPLTVLRDGETYPLVAGRHRLEACRSLGWAVVAVTVMRLDALRAELAEIDENLERSELTQAAMVKALARRKAIYESLYPEAKQGQHTGQKQSGHSDHFNRKSANGNSKKPASFASDTAAKTGRSARSVRRDAALGAKLDDKALATLAGHDILDNKAELKKLADYPAAEQRKVAAQVKFGAIHTVPDRKAADALKSLCAPLQKAIECSAVECTAAEAVALAKLSSAEQQAALNEVRAGEYASFKEWLDGKPVASIKTAKDTATKPSSIPATQAFDTAFRALGQLKKQLDGLREKWPNAQYGVAMKLLDKASDAMTAWKEAT
jgi:ParB family transcriptional regulator, chromosome partitioning protein